MTIVPKVAQFAGGGWIYCCWTKMSRMACIHSILLWFSKLLHWRSSMAALFSRISLPMRLQLVKMCYKRKRLGLTSGCAVGAGGGTTSWFCSACTLSSCTCGASLSCSASRSSDFFLYCPFTHSYPIWTKVLSVSWSLSVVLRVTSLSMSTLALTKSLLMRIGKQTLFSLSWF